MKESYSQIQVKYRHGSEVKSEFFTNQLKANDRVSKLKGQRRKILDVKPVTVSVK